jgi:hypothetical protein
MRRNDMQTIADRTNAAAEIAALDMRCSDPQTLVDAPNVPVLATPGAAAAFVVGAKVAGAGLAAFTAGVAVGEAID